MQSGSQELSAYNADIYEYIKEYFKFNNLGNTFEVFDAEIKTKLVELYFKFNNSLKATQKIKQQQVVMPQKKEDPPRIYQFFSQNPNAPKTKKEINMEKEMLGQKKIYQQVLQAGRQIFSVSINLLQLLHSMQENQKNESLQDTIENYKIQLGKYHKVILNEGKPEGQELITEAVMQEHKTKLYQNLNEKNVDGLIEVLLSLRVNALQIAPELRKNLVYELIKNDIFNISNTQKFDSINQILDINNHSLKHAITSLISVISSTLRGVEYLSNDGKNMVLISRIIRILKEQENGSVTQRFCLAILQKCSIKELVIPSYVENDMIQWVLTLLFKSVKDKIHVFCLDFSSAMLANVIHTPTTIAYLESKQQIATNVMDQLLKLLRENIPVSVLMHILICLSYLTKESFSQQMEECQLVDKISDFVEYYSQINTSGNEAAEIDKKTVLDLCAHMFHPQDLSNENGSQELKPEERIKEYENEQGELIFECFQDEVS